jgi:anti-sigma regulatory factor (Ser/Thr protein kinase)
VPSDPPTGREKTAARLVLEPTPENVSRGRSWLSDVLSRGTRLSGNQIEAATIMLSELVTNVFSHTGSKAYVSYRNPTADTVLVAVRDEGVGEPRIQPFDPLRIGGNGLRIVDAMSETWAVEHDPDGGKTVWFTIEVRR